MKIESINNTKVVNWAKLKDKKYRDLGQVFMVEGDHLMNEALRAGLVLEIIATDTFFEVPGIPFYLVNDKIIKKLSSQVSGTNVIAICKKLEEKKILGNVCLLDNLQDPGNLGTIIRSAVAFNIDTLIVSLDTVDIYNEKVIRASEGMIFALNIIKKDLLVAIDELKNLGYQIYGTDVVDGTVVNECTFKEKNAIIIGNEGRGMSDNLVSLCDKCLYIPINKRCESLNAGVAASVIFYEMGRSNEVQRNNKD